MNISFFLHLTIEQTHIDAVGKKVVSASWMQFLDRMPMHYKCHSTLHATAKEMENEMRTENVLEREL